MERKTNGWKMIANALFWAAVMIGGTYAFRNEPFGEYILFGALAGFFAINALLISGKSRRC